MTLTKEPQKLIEDNHNLIYGFLNLYHLNDDEWYDVCAIGLVNAAYYYDETKGIFSSFAYRCMRSVVCRQLKKNNSSVQTLSLESLSNDSDDGSTLNINDVIGNYDDQLQSVETVKIINDFYNKLDSDRKELFKDCFISGQDTIQIAKKFKVSKTTINNRLMRLRRELAKKLGCQIVYNGSLMLSYVK